MEPEIDLTGRQLGRYEIRSLLGRGGMGAVYRAYDPSLDRHVAIKILPPSLVADPERVRRFMQEARSASALNHPHVISIHEIGEEGEIHYIAMELVEGLTLRQLIGGSALEIKRAITIGREIAEAIGAAHDAGVIHRDLKPENIIVATSGYVKVLDFGLAKLRRDSSGILAANEATQVKSTEPGQVMGTVGYMSPEQAEGRSVDHRSDIFSLGCILYEMVSGRSPFRGRSPVDTMHNIVHAEPAPLQTFVPDVPAEMQRIADKALAKSPDERHQSAKDLAVDLKRLLREIDSSASIASGAARTEMSVDTRHRLRSRRRRIGVILGALALVIAAAVIFAIVRPRGERAAAVPAKASLNVRRLTATGNVTATAVSPDGKYIAYASSDQGQQSLWLRQLATGQDLELVPAAPVGLWGHSFSPDGASLYYALKGPDHSDGLLQSIAILGGRPRKILTGIDSPPTFSPDGKKIAYVRGAYPTKSESALIEANADGSGIRVLAKLSPPDYFVPIFFTGPSWSPDGKRIAASVITRGETNAARIVEVDVATGASNDISTGWSAAQQVAWLPAGDELLVIGSRGGNVSQVWRVPPSGEPHQITSDLFDYRTVSVTADGATIVSIVADVDADLWHIPSGTSDPPRRLRTGKAVGLGGIAVGPDGSIAYSSLDSGDYNIWITDARGANVRQLTNDAGGVGFPIFTPDGKSILFTGYGPRGMVRRIAADGTQTRATDVAPSNNPPPALTPDGLTVLVNSEAGLARVPLAGGPATPITNYWAMRPAVSPDGKRIACYCQLGPTAPQQLCVVPMTGGPPEQTFSGAGVNFRSMVQWTPDGRALLVNTTPTDRRNIWLLPLDGSEPKPLTNFSDQLLFQFAATPDRKAFIASRGEMTRDAVMISGFR